MPALSMAFYQRRRPGQGRILAQGQPVQLVGLLVEQLVCPGQGPAAAQAPPIPPARLVFEHGRCQGVVLVQAVVQQGCKFLEKLPGLAGFELGQGARNDDQALLQRALQLSRPGLDHQPAHAGVCAAMACSSCW